MTKLALLALLDHVPDSCDIYIYDSEVGMDAPVTGSYYDPIANTLTLHSGNED